MVERYLTDRLLAVWKRVLSLSWPIMTQHVLRTLMRTTDVIVAGLFSPAAVAVVASGSPVAGGSSAPFG